MKILLSNIKIILQTYAICYSLRTYLFSDKIVCRDEILIQKRILLPCRCVIQIQGLMFNIKEKLFELNNFHFKMSFFNPLKLLFSPPSTFTLQPVFGINHLTPSRIQNARIWGRYLIFSLLEEFLLQEYL